MDLSAKKCVPCKGDIPPLKGEELSNLEEELGNDWRVIDEHHLQKEYKFKNFREGLGFVNRVGEIAEEQNHHPAIELSYTKVIIRLWTHKINGLTESDFIFAAKCEAV